MDPYVKLAKQTIEIYIKEKEIIDPPADLPKEMFEKRAGVFVSIKKKTQLRGCIGTFLPTEENLAKEIIHNAISAGFHDPRFQPIKESELEDLKISVDILSEPEPIDSLDKLDAKKYGIIVKTKDGRSGLLLPNIEGVNIPQEQVSICCEKGNIDPDKDELLLYRFEVTRHEQEHKNTRIDCSYSCILVFLYF